ncbi:uncharacterized protein LOC142349876 isoform X2 [Convolutriloba macropyga]|uniref:uncharacterized protein LOC142349876 isoform X2 n=1 Tax=Convolutriloba macropyga TaxID=536237 RepID=UPI003F51DA7A
MNSSYSILRFKRRQSEDRPETIAVQCKKPKLDGSEVSDSVIFKYVGHATDDSSIELTLSQIDSPVRKKRSLTKSGNDGMNKHVLDSHSKNCRSVSVSKRRKVGENIELIEVAGNTPLNSNDLSNVQSDSDLLSCNGLKLMRDKLNISEEPSSSACYNSDGDDLFDLYYHCWSHGEEIQAFDPLDILYVAPLSSHDLLEDSENENVGDSDSNDEDNWRNDYPDSPYSLSESSQSDDSFSQSRHVLRHRNWNADGGNYISDYDNTQYGFFHDPTDFFDRYSDHVHNGEEHPRNEYQDSPTVFTTKIQMKCAPKLV